MSRPQTRRNGRGDGGDASALERAYASRAAFDPTHPTVLAVYCSDGRFTRAVEDLRRAATTLRAHAPTLEIRLYFARRHGHFDMRAIMALTGWARR